MLAQLRFMKRFFNEYPKCYLIYLKKSKILTQNIDRILEKLIKVIKLSTNKNNVICL